MRRRTATACLSIALSLLAFDAGVNGGPDLAVAGPLTFAGDLDIGEMLSEARATWDFGSLDAVLLLESARFTWSEDGRQREERHRVVWIGTDVAQDMFADLRVPWDSERQSFTVQALRVWRDDRWIVARPTAVVQTTPFALRAAPDYAGIRETMLLHDGIELPCILECAYVIEDTVAHRAGIDGEWVFQHAVPALNSWLNIEAPAATVLSVWSAPGVSADPEIARPDGAAGRRVFSYRMRRMTAAPLPAPVVPAAALPYVRWSTHASPSQLGAVIAGAVTGGFALDATLRDSLAAVVAGAPCALDKAQRIADFVERSQHRIDYDLRLLLPRARPASRVFETAYGGDLDLSVLAGALLEGAGFTVWPAMLGRGFGDLDEGGWSLDRFQGPGLWISGEDFEAYWDASSSQLHQGGAPLHGRALWRLGRDERAGVLIGDDAALSHLAVAVDLRWDAKGGSWSGGGYLDARGAFSPHDLMAHPSDAARKRLELITAGVLSGATVESFAPQAFAPPRVAMHWDLKAVEAKRDSLGRLPLVIGSPPGGLTETLPHDVQLYLADRVAPVLLPGPLEQSVSVSIVLGGLTVVRLPEPTTVENSAGRFELTVSRDGEKVTVSRSTHLPKARIESADWPALRELLLADADRGNRTVLLK